MLKTPKGMNTRPTTDRVKETLFNIIRNEIPDARVLDLFSGSGSLSIEALSRGAQSAVLIDRDAECASIIKQNLQHTRLDTQAKVFCVDYQKAIKKLAENGEKFSLVFLDPPYDKGFVKDAMGNIMANSITCDNALFVIERSKTEEIGVDFAEIIREETFGNTVISILRQKIRNI